MWFGTKDYATWIEPPLSGADSSPTGWATDGTLLNGGGYAFNSFNSHKVYNYAWSGASTQKDAQTMKSFADGTFGRGKIYFQEPNIYRTNVLPARWADPSITCDYEGPSLVPGVDPIRIAMTGTNQFQLPVFGAQYNLNNVAPAVETVFTPLYENLFTNPRLVGSGGLTATGVTTTTAGGKITLTSTVPSNPACYVWLAVPIPLRTLGGTVVGEITLDAPLTGALDVNSRQIRVHTPVQASPQPPNEAGSYKLRLDFDPLTGGNTLRFYHGGLQDSGEVSWSNIGIFEAGYTGPAFSGSDGSVVINGQTLETRWTGTPDNSTSQAGTLTATGPVQLDDSNSVFIPIPEGKQLHLGAFYQATGTGGIYVSPVARGGSATSQVTKVRPNNTGELFSTVVSRQPGTIGVYLWIGKTNNANASVTVNAIHGRIADPGEPIPGENHWYGGQGHSGVRFTGKPTYVTRNAINGGQIEFAATFKEVQD